MYIHIYIIFKYILQKNNKQDKQKEETKFTIIFKKKKKNTSIPLETIQSISNKI